MTNNDNFTQFYTINILFIKTFKVFYYVIIMILDDKNIEKNIDKFYCIKCNFKCFRESDWDRHVSTLKHNKMITINNNNYTNQNNYFICECGKQYKYRQGLFVHKKVCNILLINKINNIQEEKNIIITLLEENNKLQNQIIELCKEKKTLTNINNINSHNKTFNLNVFLNETCKDAMNIMDFVDSIKLQLSDLENVGKLGYIEGISNIITSNLKALDITQRPVHCTDKKRDVLYVKDENKWEKDETRVKLRSVIKKVVSKNQRVLPQFKEKYPDCNTSISKFSDQYNKIIIEAMGGYGENDLEKEDKIIKNIAKNVLIDK